MYLDHVTLVADDLESIRAFFVDIAGLRMGPRPPFGVEGYWLYLDGRPIVHLVRRSSPANRVTRMSTSRIDHLAFRLCDPAAWHALIARLTASRLPYQIADVPLSGERQAFVQLGPAVTVEFITPMSRD
ncbi:extradiol dioxygenase [Pandoraea morbifera]|uniref:extradiol dioxygenase n=1 Tax=Pandoraea morbifera TaxID=2508300 RepID=UPI0012427F0B|nr:extradiol dioxygenase [Pandoraea morbifera]